MADNDNIRSPQDLFRVNLSEEFEVRYWTEMFGVSTTDLHDAVCKVGTFAAAVEHELQRALRLHAGSSPTSKDEV